MKLLVRSPKTPSLGEHIDKLWFCEDPAAFGTERVAPTGLSQIVVPFAENASDPVMAGVFTNPQPIDARDKRRACGVVSRPGHTGAFVEPPLRDFTDLEVPLQELWQGDGRYVAERLADATTPDEVFDRLELALVAALNPDWSADDAAIAGAHLLNAGAGVQQVVDQLDVDRRKFGVAFTNVLGVAPKHFSRIRRFQLALRVVRSSADIPLSELAAELGFSDQAHMTREFREFSGSTPGEVHGVDIESPGHFRTD